MPLTVKKVEKLVARGRHFDEHGLYLQVKSPTNRSWLLRYVLNGKERWMGLGAEKNFSLDEARELARAARQQISKGVDPVTERQREIADQQARAVIFRTAAQGWWQIAKVKWDNEKYAKQVLSQLERYAYPILGDMVVGKIERSHVRQALMKDDFWTTKHDTAEKVQGYIERVLDYCTTNDWREGPNPAMLKGNLALLLPDCGKQDNHHASLEYKDLPDFMIDLRDREGISARAMEFLILCASRTGEVIGALRDEVDWDERVWTIPASRMKIRSNGDHRVPLSDEGFAILKELPTEKGNPYLFIGPVKDCLSNMAMIQLLKRMGRPDITTHGFRSTFKVWATERTTFPDVMSELALSHTVGNDSYRAYMRSDMMERRREMMQVWARFCATPFDKSNVLTLRAVEQAA